MLKRKSLSVSEQMKLLKDVDSVVQKRYHGKIWHSAQYSVDYNKKLVYGFKKSRNFEADKKRLKTNTVR